MKLVRIDKPGPPGVMQILDVPVPEPKPGEVLIKAHAIGVGMPDCLIRAGTYSWMPPLPATPGTELAGIVDKVGAGVTTRRAGDRVYTTARERPHRGGHYAQYVATPAEATFVLPSAVSFDPAATLANYQVAYHIFHDALSPSRGQSVLIYAAAGGMGNALIDLAKVFSLAVIGVVSSDVKARFAREMGADHVVNRKTEEMAVRIDAITQGLGVDIIIDPVGGPSIPGNLAARTVRHSRRLWWARRQGAARPAGDVPWQQELAGDPAVFHPYLGSSGRGTPRRHAGVDRHACRRKASSAHSRAAAARRCRARPRNARRRRGVGQAAADAVTVARFVG